MLLGCGIVSSVWYVATDIIATLRYDGYRYSEQQFSEYLAEGAPTRPLMLILNVIPYTVLVSAFALGIWASAGQHRAGRITAALLVGYAVTGAAGGGIFNMDRREVLATGEGTLRNAMHPPATMVMSLCVLLAMGFGAELFGTRFRYYSYGTIATLIVFGALTATQIPQLEANESTPWMGIEERANIYALMLWTAVLGVALLRAHSATDQQRLGTPRVTPQRMQRLPQ